MHVMSSGRSSFRPQSKNGGGGGRQTHGTTQGQHVIQKGEKAVYRIGNQKITIDGKNGKTLDDIIEELVATSSDQRNWKGIIISILVILAVFGLIVAAVFAMTPPEEAVVLGRPIAFGEFLAGNLTGTEVNVSWISDTELVFLDSSGSVILLTVPDLTRKVLVPNSTYRNYEVAVFAVSADRKFVSFATEVVKNFRHSYWAKYLIYEVDTGTIHRVETVPASSLSGPAERHPRLDLFRWSPVGNGFAFVYHNDVFYRPAVANDSVVPITSDGVPGIVFNGVPDWIYEEEILSSGSALWFSPEGGRLAFGRFDDTHVEDVGLTMYEPELASPYTRHAAIRYPKAGATNPTVQLRMVNLNDIAQEQTHVLHPPSSIKNGDHYLVTACWASASTLASVWMNREQNLSVVAHCSEHNKWLCTEVYSEATTRSAGGWVGLYACPVYHPNASEPELLVTAPVLDGQFGRFRHVMRVRFGQAGDPKATAGAFSSVQHPMTHGRFEVVAVHGWSKDAKYIYFTATAEGEPTHRHLYRVRASLNATRTSESATSELPECLSCHLVTFTNKTETEISLLLRNYAIQSKGADADAPLPRVVVAGGCLFNEAHFSRSLSHLVLHCKGPDLPRTMLFAVGDFPAHNANANASANATHAALSPLSVLDASDELRMRALNVSLPKVRTFQVPLSSGYSANVKLFLPPEITVHTFTSFPLIVHVYGGPGSQICTSEWSHGGWPAFLASSRRWIVAQVDGRGSGGDGDRRKFELWRKLGQAEVVDQLEVARFLADNLPIVDPRRIGVWGWSYGGYAALRAISVEKQNVFQCGVAVAPVTSWRFYDSVYAERYMGQPGADGNFLGYEQSDVMSRAKFFRPTKDTLRRIFLVHGTGDDNVHVQHSMVLARALVKEGVEFQQQIYPDSAHSLRNVRPHLYQSMESFFDDCFKDVAKEERKSTAAIVIGL